MMKECCCIYHQAGLFPHHQQCSLCTRSHSKVVPSISHQSCGICANPCSNLIIHKHEWLYPSLTSHTPCHSHSHKTQWLWSNNSSLVLHVPIHRPPSSKLFPLLLSHLWIKCPGSPPVQVPQTSLLPLWATWSCPYTFPSYHLSQPWPFQGHNMEPPLMRSMRKIGVLEMEL